MLKSISVPVSILLAVAAAFVAGLALSGNPAQAKEPSKVICSQLPQKQMLLDEQFIATFMSEQIAEGRTRFESIRGPSTVLCSW